MSEMFEERLSERTEQILPADADARTGLLFFLTELAGKVAGKVRCEVRVGSSAKQTIKTPAGPMDERPTAPSEGVPSRALEEDRECEGFCCGLTPIFCCCADVGVPCCGDQCTYGNICCCRYGLRRKVPWEEEEEPEPEPAMADPDMERP